VNDKKKMTKKKANRIQDALSVTSKYIDISASRQMGAAWGLDVLTGAILQGNTVNTRAGDRIVQTRISFRYSVTCADAYNLGRIVIVQVVPSNAATSFTVGANNIFDGGIGGSARDLYSPMSFSNGSQFKVLWDQQISMCQNGSSVTQFNVWQRDLPIKTALFSAGSVYSTQGLYVFYISDSAVIPNPVLTYQCRIWFTDS